MPSQPAAKPDEAHVRRGVLGLQAVGHYGFSDLLLHGLYFLSCVEQFEYSVQLLADALLELFYFRISVVFESSGLVGQPLFEGIESLLDFEEASGDVLLAEVAT